jgi:hypothetical protein
MEYHDMLGHVSEATTKATARYYNIKLEGKIRNLRRVRKSQGLTEKCAERQLYSTSREERRKAIFRHK